MEIEDWEKQNSWFGHPVQEENKISCNVCLYEKESSCNYPCAECFRHDREKPKDYYFQIHMNLNPRLKTGG